MQRNTLKPLGLTPFGKCLVKHCRSGGFIKYGGQEYWLRPNPDFSRISHFLHPTQSDQEWRGSLAGQMDETDARELDRVFAGCAINRGISDQKRAEALLTLAPEMPRLSLAEAASVFATAFTLGDLEKMNRTLDALGKDMPPPKRALGLFEGLYLLPTVAQRRVLSMRGAQVFAEAFAILQPEHLNRALNTLGELMRRPGVACIRQDGEFARAMLDGLDLLSGAQKTHLLGMLGEPTMALLFRLADPHDLNRAFDVSINDMDPASHAGLVVNGFRSLAKSKTGAQDKRRVLDTLGPRLFAASFALPNLRDWVSALDALTGHLPAADQVCTLLDWLALVPQESRIHLRDTHGGPLMARMLELADPENMSRVLDAVGMDMDSQKRAHLIFASAFTLVKPRNFKEAWHALGVPALRAAEWVRATLDGFAVLSKESRVYVRQMHGGPFMTKMLILADPGHMSHVVDVLGMELDPVNRARFLLQGFQYLSATRPAEEQWRVMDELGPQLFAAAFSLRESRYIHAALEVLKQRLTAQQFVSLALDGFRLLPREDRIRVRLTLGKPLKAALLISSSPRNVMSRTLLKAPDRSMGVRTPEDLSVQAD